MQGKTLNGFELKQLLGVGGMAEVWYAENEIGMKAAVKILSEELSHNAQMKERFLNEAKVMVQLDHSNIRKVLGYGAIDGRPAIIMEYLDGSDLKSRMKNGQRFTEEELERWWNQLVSALNYTHQRGIVHRDIKPSNIFVDAEGNVKLLDFGIAKVRESIGATQTGQKLGTLMYMSPEQVHDPKRVGAASDVYSLAVTFVHLLTGKVPYDSDSSSDYDIQESIVRKPLDLSAVPSGWRDFLAPYLEKGAGKRPALRCFEAMPLPKQPVTPPADKDEGTVDDSNKTPIPTDKTQNKKPLWIALAIAAVAALLVFLLWPAKDNPADPTPEEPTLAERDSIAFHGCQTVPDYRSYIAEYGQDAKYYAEAIDHIQRFVEDSTRRVQHVQDSLMQVQQQDEAERKESDAFAKCNTIAGCDAYLNAYPHGRYEDQVRQKRSELKEKEAYEKCTTIAGCQAYLAKYPDGQYVKQVNKRLADLQKPSSQPPTGGGSSQGNGNQTTPPSQGATGTASGHEYVDLGLPSGTLWATCNIGASTPEGYGNYYAWGETSPKSTYNWESYKYANGTSWNDPRLTKYCNVAKYGNNGFTDNLTTLQAGDDPATANWGSGWRTPSNKQWEELRDNTTQKWTTQGGKEGMLFTSKKNGRTLFLPAAGLWGGEVDYVGSYGLYWSRSLYTDSPHDAWGLNFLSGGCYMYNGSRRNGFSVRPVREN